MAVKRPVLSSPPKRIVLVDAKGLYQIGGLCTDISKLCTDHAFLQTPNFAASLVRVTTRYALYREIVPPTAAPVRGFHAEQR